MQNVLISKVELDILKDAKKDIDTLWAYAFKKSLEHGSEDMNYDLCRKIGLRPESKAGFIFSYVHHYYNEEK